MVKPQIRGINSPLGCGDTPHPTSQADSAEGRHGTGWGGGACFGSSLDSYGQNCTLKREWTKQEKRAYQRIKSGLEKHHGERLRFLTLTSAPEMKRPINDAWRVLKERIRRLTPARLIRDGYIEPSDMRRYYPNKRLKERLRFDYYKVRTTEGVSGVIHVLYFGDYIPQKWLSDAWREITGSAYVVDIRACKDEVKDVDNLARYCVAQYVASQEGGKRFSWSWGWVFKGFVAVWRQFVRELGVRQAIKAWRVFLRRGWVWIEGFAYPKPPPAWGGLVVL